MERMQEACQTQEPSPGKRALVADNAAKEARALAQLDISPAAVALRSYADGSPGHADNEAKYLQDVANLLDVVRDKIRHFDVSGVNSNQEILAVMECVEESIIDGFYRTISEAKRQINMSDGQYAHERRGDSE